MASKSACVVLIDVGASMRSMIGTKESRLECVKQSVKQILHEKMMFSPKEIVGLVLCGSEETKNQLNEQSEDDPPQYEHVSVISHMKMPDMKMISSIDTIQESSAKADLLDGMIVALDLIFRATAKKKFRKSLVLVTDGATPVSDVLDLDVVVPTMKTQLSCSLNVITIDMDDETSDNIQKENLKMLHGLIQSVGGSLNDSKHIARTCNKRSVAQVTKFKGDLEIGVSLKLPVVIYTKIRRESFPTLLKESQSSFNKGSGGEVKMDRVYKLEDKEVSDHERIKAFKYGTDYIPFSEADIASLKNSTERSFQFLAFLNREQVNGSMFLGGCDVVLAAPGQAEAQQAISSLARAMKLENRVGLARIVTRKNSAPKIVALLPCIDEYEGFYLHPLPFVEDMRQYEFDSLDPVISKLTRVELNAGESVVDSLMTDPQGKYDIANTYNPTLQAFFKAIQRRAETPSYVISPLYTDIPKLPDVAQRNVEAFSEVFKLRDAAKATEKKKRKFWSDLLNKKSTPVVQPDFHEEDEDLDFEALLNGNSLTKVGSLNPISDFEALLATHDSDKVRAAIVGICEQAIQLVPESLDKAVSCIVHFYRRADEINQMSEYHALINLLRRDYPVESNSELWEKLAPVLVSNEPTETKKTIEMKTADEENDDAFDGME